MRRFLLILVAAGVVSAIALASAFADVSDAVSYRDPAGDSGGELDITLVSVDADRKSGTVKFAVTVTGFDPASWDGRRRIIQVYLLNRSTGSELMLEGQGGPQGILSSLGRLSGSPSNPWSREPLPPTMSFSQGGNVLTWTFNKAELGITEGFDFNLATQIAVPAAGTWRIVDEAPGAALGRWWHYSIATEPAPPPQSVAVKPVFGSAITVPSRPVAGKRLLFTLAVTRSDTGAPLMAGKMVCDPSVAGVVLKHAESFRNGKARLSFVVPKTAKGKLLKVNVKITNGAQSASKLVTFRVM